jgi:SAM-dependent methyltransferase
MTAFPERAAKTPSNRWDPALTARALKIIRFEVARSRHTPRAMPNPGRGYNKRIFGLARVALLAFQDHFSHDSKQYVAFRPKYPAELFPFLASLPRGRDCAWDCATGNGQAAVDLAMYFREVIATDPSASQLAQARPRPHVTYLLASAEQCPLTAGSVDLVTVAQALHWFDIERFYEQVRRVARPGSILAVWSYGLATISPQVDRVVGYLYHDLLGPYWPPQRKMTDDQYMTIPFPFEEVLSPKFEMLAQWNLDHLVGYLGTWSSTQRFMHTHAANPLDRVDPDLRSAWGPAETLREVRWPLYLRVGRIC